MKPIPIEQPQLATRSVSTDDLLQTLLASGNPTQNIDAFERLVALRAKEMQQQAEREYVMAFVALQSEIPKIEPTRDIHGKDGRKKYSYAPFEEIMRKVRPLLTKHNFSISFDSQFSDGKVLVKCTLQHIGGHKTETHHSARVGSGPIHSSEAQADGAAQTYAKRFALCSALNIVIEHDTDGAADADDPRNMGGEPITESQAADLQSLCEESGADKAKFLAWLEVESFAKIPSIRLEEARTVLERRRK